MKVKKQTGASARLSSSAPARGGDVLDELIADWKREKPNLDAAAMGIVGRIIHLGTLLQSDANRVLKPFGLRYTDFDVLATLRRRGRPYQLTPTQLTRSVLITSGAMTACIDRLERSALIERKPDPGDRRGIVVRLTRKGEALVDRAVAARFDLAADEVAALGKTDAATLAALLRKLTVSLA